MLDKILKTFLIIFGSLVLIAAGGYAVISCYYDKKFMFGTSVNGRNIQGMSLEEANEYLVNTYQPGVDYSRMKILLEGRDGYSETVKGSEINLRADMSEELSRIKQSQKPYEWPVYMFYEDSYDALPVISYNRKLLHDRLSSLDCVGDKNNDPDPLVEIRNEKGNFFLYDNIVDHVDAGKLIDKVEAALGGAQDEVIKIELEDCYEPHVIPEKFDKAVRLYDKIEKVADSSITFEDAPLNYTLTGKVVERWLMTGDDGLPIEDESGNLVIDEEKLNGYTDTLAKVFDTSGGTIDWKKRDGEVVSIKNAMPGYVVDKEAEAEKIRTTFLKGEKVTRAPVYLEEGKGRGQDVVGKTYIEVDMSSQKLYYYVDGKLSMESDVVTGNLARGNGTPAKLCYVYFKQRNRTLRGPNYATFVNYWMAVSGHIGIHDATWRGKFGGEIYKTAGSHGCVNVPKDFAAKLYDVVEVGTPCVLYY